ncbi:hypothetical protein CB0940_07147 [Cercospora beticola]|uniref:BTB domain-containing protein n=1 Tax=Cercospora beticola TaxID=122368 RepID=A0A2G5HAZ1_CERBT|nr:hypothetical protein CB0940_07147 [Cercospora beticola]PIA89412.1 hypothetical protein CB0940_07147 [Cercospora beticola]WPB03074.1 hypothetical protein RHO25_007711 [Cercospora beticola]CAK1358221.1 unnamed protein product [Cercospora beticola]
MENEAVDELIRSLASDKLITLHIGNNSETSFSVHIQQKFLEVASTWFQKAFRDSKCEQTSVFTFTDDDPDTWKTVLYWIMHHKLPENKDKTNRSEKFIRNAKYWIVGHKYGIAGFQDEIMIQLLKEVDDHGPCVLTEREKCADLIAVTPPESVLMRLLAEVVVEDEDDPGTYRFTDDIPELKHNTGFWTAYVKALQDFRGDGLYFDSRLVMLEDCSPYYLRAHWRDYMVGELPALVHYLKDDIWRVND